jgi:hypothetical protein
MVSLSKTCKVILLLTWWLWRGCVGVVLNDIWPSIKLSETGAVVSHFVITTNAPMSQLGKSVTLISGGQVAIGAPGTNNSRGVVYVLSGRPRSNDTTAITVSPSSSALVVATGRAEGDALGYPISHCPDINGDSRVELMASALQSASHIGEVWLLMSSSSSFSNFTTWTPHVITGAPSGRNLGLAIGGLGRIDGDDQVDVLLSMYGRGSDTGAVYIVSASALLAMPTNATLDMIVNTTHTIAGGTLDKYLGSGMVLLHHNLTRGGGSGDFNGDRIPDTVFANPQTPGSQFVSVLFGSATNTSWPPNLWPKFYLLGFTVITSNTCRGHGSLVGIPGDVDGDGLDELIIACQSTTSQSYVGVIFGSADPNIKLDYVRASTVYNGTTGVKLLLPLGVQATPFALVDFNGDGFDDVAVGSYSNMSTVAGSPKVWIVFGHPRPWAPSIQLSSLSVPNATGVVISFDSLSVWSIQSLSSAGDFDGDAVEDLMVGCATAAPLFLGRVYIVYGNAPPRIVWNTFRVGAGSWAPLSAANITVVDNQLARVRVFVVSCLHGFFAVQDSPAMMITSFTIQQLVDGVVLFQHDRPGTQPAVTLQPWDGQMHGLCSVSSIHVDNHSDDSTGSLKEEEVPHVSNALPLTTTIIICVVGGAGLLFLGIVVSSVGATVCLVTRWRHKQRQQEQAQLNLQQIPSAAPLYSGVESMEPTFFGSSANGLDGVGMYPIVDNMDSATMANILAMASPLFVMPPSLPPPPPSSLLIQQNNMLTHIPAATNIQTTTTHPCVNK